MTSVFALAERHARRRLHADIEGRLKQQSKRFEKVAQGTRQAACDATDTSNNPGRLAAWSAGATITPRGRAESVQGLAFPKRAGRCLEFSPPGAAKKGSTFSKRSI